MQKATKSICPATDRDLIKMNGSKKALAIAVKEK